MESKVIVNSVTCAQDVANRLEKPKNHGNYWTAKCPAHDDNKSSLSITDKDGKILFKCHAGCSQESVLSALKDRGAWPEYENNRYSSKTFKAEQKKPNPIKKPAKVSKRAKIISQHDYRDEHGELIFQSIRMEPKDFRQRQPDGKGGWNWSLKGCRMVPYNLPEVLACTKGVCIVEGEKDADNLMRLGVCATTSPSGAGKWRKEYNDHFKGKTVIILPDNDQPGKQHAQMVADNLFGIADSIKIVYLPGPEKSDVSDFLESGGTKEVLAEMIKKAKPYERPANDREYTNVVEHPKMAELGDDDWQLDLIYSKTKDGDKVLASRINNGVLICKHHPDMVGVLAYNEFSKSVEFIKSPPWGDGALNYPCSIQDYDDVLCAAWLERQHINIGVKAARDVMSAAAFDNTYNPLQEYLKSLRWDGQPRVENALCDFLGCEPTTYNNAVSKRFLIGAVARAMEPGCKMDNMLILEGDQGLMKSTATRVLFGKNWFTDELSDLGSKDAAMQVQGVWCVEVAELTSLGRAESSRIKEWVTRRVDRYRPPYGRSVVEAPRQCVLVGTVNPESAGYLNDPTGARRFWPVKCTHIDLNRIKENRDQVWAEAMHLYKEKERWWLSQEESELAQDEQENRQHGDSWETVVSNFLEGKYSLGLHEVLDHCLEIPKSQQNRSAQMRASNILKKNGFHRVRKNIQGKRIWVYERI